MMSTLGDRIKKLRKKAKIRQEDLATELGITTRTVQYYESGERRPDQKQLIAIARYFGTTTDYLLGVTDDPTINISEESNKRDFLAGNGTRQIEVDKIPVYRIGKVGDKIFADENIIDWQYVPAQLMDHIGMLVADNSMDGSSIKEGSIIIVKPQNDAETGQIVVVLYQGTILIRRINYVDGGVILSPDNANYQPVFVPSSELHIIGIVAKVVIDVI